MLSKSSHWWKDETPSSGSNGKGGPKFDANGRLVSTSSTNGNGKALSSNGSLKNGVSSAKGEGAIPTAAAKA